MINPFFAVVGCGEIIQFYLSLALRRHNDASYTSLDYKTFLQNINLYSTTGRNCSLNLSLRFKFEAFFVFCSAKDESEGSFFVHFKCSIKVKYNNFVLRKDGYLTVLISIL